MCYDRGGGENMTVGDKIKKIRLVRGMTQKELGEKVGLTDVRIRQYELNNRTPKEEMLRKIAEVLEVNYYALCEPKWSSMEELVFALFELEEENWLRLQLLPNTLEDEQQKEVGIVFEKEKLKKFLKEWFIRKDELQKGEIEEKEYEEWKRSWSQTSDGSGDKIEMKIEKKMEE